MVVKEGSKWGRHDINATDERGVSQFTSRVEGRKRFFSCKESKAFGSTKNKSEFFKSFTRIYLGMDTNISKKLADVHKVTPSPNAQANVFFTENHSNLPDVMIRGTSGEKCFEITEGGSTILATVNRDYASAEALQYGKDTYSVHINEGVDRALIFVLVTIIEEMFVGPTQN